MDNQDINKGRALNEFARVFEVQPSPGNVGQLLLRKDTSKVNEQDNVLTLIASCFFECGLVYGAQIVCHDRRMQDDLFHSFTQEDADAIARRNLQDVTVYLEQIRDGVQHIEVIPKNEDGSPLKVSELKGDFKTRVQEEIKKAKAAGKI